MTEKVIFPIHPRTRNVLKQHQFDFAQVPNIEFIDPVGYIDMLSLLKHCELMTTDSGGVQKEAYWMGKQCVTIRSETEWIETLKGGWNTLVFDELDSLTRLQAPDPSIYDPDLYGGGNAAAEIVACLRRAYQRK
jgi:UDP-GlcNAc3NAcA epimerase